MKLRLEQIEARLQALIEVRLVSVLPGYHLEDLVIQKFASAMKNDLIDDGEGARIAPNVFTLVVHPDASNRWQHPKLLEAMLNSLKIVGEEAGLQFKSPPTISIVQNLEQQESEIEVLASHQLVEATSETKGMTPATEDSPETIGNSIPANAFLIVDGVKVFPLKDPVVNIGRRLDNQLVIDDPRISRSHAQLRAIKGRYVIFDLNSTGGTFVNAQRTSQSVLYPGDVISLAGVPLVFGQDNPPQRPDLMETHPFNQASADRPTAFLRQTSKSNQKDEEQE